MRLVLILLLLLLIPTVFAEVTLKPGTLLKLGSYFIYADSNLYADKVEVKSDRVVFINVRLTTVKKNFSLSMALANLSITEITQDYSKFILYAPSNTVSNMTYFYSGSQYPGVVDVGNERVSEPSYYRNLNDFKLASPPAVFLNETGKYIVVKGRHSSPLPVTIYDVLPAENPPVGGGGGGTGTTTTTTFVPPSIPSIPRDERLNIGIIIIVAAFLGMVVLGVGRRKRSRRSPEKPWWEQ